MNQYALEVENVTKEFADFTLDSVNFRLEKGMELLKSTSLTVTEIAGACGFNSASYFTELFTRQKGVSPKAYRKSV